MRALLATGLTFVITACTGATHQLGNGTIVGTAPLCYGPGPNMNLHPNVTIKAVRTDGLTRALHVSVSNGHADYRMTLPAGSYTISAYSGRVSAVVRPHITTHGVDLPQPGCL